MFIVEMFKIQKRLKTVNIAVLIAMLLILDPIHSSSFIEYFSMGNVFKTLKKLILTVEKDASKRLVQQT